MVWALLLTVAMGGEAPLYYGSPVERCMTEGPCPAVVKPVKVTASSTLVEGSMRHDAARVVDGKLDTAWCEGQPGSGVGASITLHFDREVQVEFIEIWGGYFKDERRLFSNERLERYHLTLEGMGPIEVRTTDVPRDGFKASAEWPNHFTPSWASMRGSSIAPKEHVTSITIEAVSVFPGDKYTDLCISEVKVYE